MMLIRQAAFAGPEKMLKGGLHCHTTRSDGENSPETVIRQYTAMGYDFLALTDHRRYNYENFAPETGLMILPGMELDANPKSPGHYCVHIVSVGPEKEKGNGFEQDQRFESSNKDTVEESTIPLLNAIQQAANLPIFCHPEWSGNTAQDILCLPDIRVMEIWNSGCAKENGLDTHAAYWDEVLVTGREMYGAATDDGHHLCHNGLGWVRVRAERNPSAVLDALRNGAFYSSCGPEIYDFYVEDDRAVVICSPVEIIRFRHFRVPYLECHGSGIMGHQIKIAKHTGYIRAEIVDSMGRLAWTNPIFLDEEYWKQFS